LFKNIILNLIKRRNIIIKDILNNYKTKIYKCLFYWIKYSILIYNNDKYLSKYIYDIFNLKINFFNKIKFIIKQIINKFCFILQFFFNLFKWKDVL